ncbi:MAG: hypothetical protein Q9226_002375 [Calogaya cf. arnoldii]
MEKVYQGPTVARPSDYNAFFGLNEGTAGLKPGKELVAACAIESRTPGPSPNSFTAALVQELNNAVTNQYFMTAAQLFFEVLEKVHKGDLVSTPVYVEAMIGPQPRTSIFLEPLEGGDTWNESPYPGRIQKMHDSWNLRERGIVETVEITPDPVQIVRLGTVHRA